jgi:hypothetical protein
MAALEHFTASYLAAALWSSTDDDGTPLDANYSPDDIDPEILEWMRAECARFYAENRDDIECDGAPNANDGSGVAGMAGHDFWLTRNGHGAGFWDGDWPEPQASRLTDAAHALGEVDLYVGDDGRLHA